MSFVRTIRKNLKKILTASFLTLFLGIFLSINVYADFGTFVGDLFKTGEKGLSFTQYTGQLAQLSSEGFDQALVASSDLREFIIKVVKYALGFLGLIAVIIVIYGGVLYVTAAGEDEKTQKGKKAITYAAVGLLIVLGSFAFVNTVIKGGTGGVEEGGGATAITTTQGFNASAEQVRSLAMQIYSGFAFLTESTEELKNIKNDIEKDSLKPTNLPGKNDILEFLSSIGNKLNNMKSKLQPFTVAEAKINNLLRDMDNDIDKINNTGNKEWMKIAGEKAEYCDVEAERSDWEGMTDASDEEICKDKYPNYYNTGLYEAWNTIYKKYTEQNGDLYGLIKPIADDYYIDLKRIFTELSEIYTNYSNIQAIGSQGSTANTAYTYMIGASGYGYKYANGQISEDGSGLLKKIKDWKIDSAIDTVGNQLVYGLKQHSIIFEELLKLKFVQARLTADTIEGPAPLIVNFNALATVDPAGGSVQGDHIVWDLAGTQTVDTLTSAPAKYNEKTATLVGTMLVPKDNSVDCTFTPPKGKSEDEFIGKTAKRCIYRKPGTYTAAVKIESNDQTKYAPGISVLTIKVRPPTTKIELTVQGSGDPEPHTVMHYKDDVLDIDKSSISVTANDAKNGVTFDASNTKDVKSFKFDYGDGSEPDENTNGKFEKHKYKEASKYVVTLEVTSVLEVKDKKIFTLEISSIAAKLKASPSDGSFINDTVLFDASQSKSDIGKIVNYKWTIKPTVGQPIPSSLQQDINKEYPFTQEGGSMKTLTYQFKYPINYDITVEVRDDGKNIASASIENYRVQSQPPVAQFDYAIPDKTQPGTFVFDASKSFDPDGTKNFKYAWTLTPATDWKLIEKPDNTLNSKKPTVKFQKEGDYDVTLKVTDEINSKEYNEITKTVKVENILDIAWDKKQQVTSSLDENGEAEIEFDLISENAKNFEVDFGDGETANGELGSDEIIHKYTKAGKFTVKINVYDDEDNENTIDKKIFISGGDQPIAKIKVSVNGEEIPDLSEPVKVSKKDIVTFDAIDSKNSDGTNKNLKFSWDFGDNKNSSKQKATHTYKELSPKDPGYYKVRLTIIDSKDPEKTAEDEVRIEVINLPPIFSSVQGTPQPVDNILVTPVNVMMKVYGAEDPDGEITNYRWWYFDANNPEQQYGIQTTTSPAAKLIIGTRGKQGQEITYGFGLEIRDSDGLIYSNEEEIGAGQSSKLTVTNGANALPLAKFNVNAPAIFVGDKIMFTSSSTDPDGKIKDYIWDFDGDGFYNDDPTQESSVEHIYKAINKTGIEVRLKVVDDKGGESISDPIKIYVDSLAEPPTAAFTFEPIAGSDGMKIKFTNTATADKKAGAEILNLQWDFDTESLLPNADSNGDGKKDNDIDSQAKNPERLFIAEGTYKVKLTVTDNQGNKDEVINPVKVPLATPPLAAFTYEIKDGQAVFKNTSTTDVKSGSIITKYVWDFDTDVDSNGDGKKDNDSDSQLKDPSYTYPQTGKYQVKLTVVDNNGGSDDVTNDVHFTVVPSPDNGGNADVGGQPNNSTLLAVMTTDPAPGTDSVVYLNGTSGTVKFNFTKSIGAIQYYTFDKNIYYDTDGNGNKTDDQDFKTTIPGTWTTNFDKSWGQIVVKLTVMDIYGNTNNVTQEVKFNSPGA